MLTRSKSKYIRELKKSHYVGYVLDEETPEQIMEKFGKLENLKLKDKQKLSEKELNNVFELTSSKSTKLLITKNMNDKNSNGIKLINSNGHHLKASDIYVKSDNNTKRMNGYHKILEERNILENHVRIKRNYDEKCDDKIDHDINKEFYLSFKKNKRLKKLNKDKQLLVELRKTTKDEICENKNIGTTINIFESPVIFPFLIDKSKEEDIYNMSRDNRSYLKSIYKETNDILSLNYYELVKGEIVGILMKPPWKNSNNKSSKGIIPYDLKKLNLSVSLAPNTILCIWIKKELTYDITKIIESMNFQYVETLSWIKMRGDNRIGCEDSPMLKTSYETLLIFRRKYGNTTLELKHQRTCDVFFDYMRIDKKTGEVKKPRYFIYKMMETLLPSSMKKGKSQNPLLLELWGIKGEKRSGWTNVVYVE